MVSPIATRDLSTFLHLEMWQHAPGTTSAKVASPDGGATERWLDMRDYNAFGAMVAATFCAGDGVVLVEIVASPTPDEDDSDLVVVKSSGTIAADALADWAWLECTRAEIAVLGESCELRYVAARITTQHEGDEAMVTYVARVTSPGTPATAATTIS